MHDKFDVSVGDFQVASSYSRPSLIWVVKLVAEGHRKQHLRRSEVASMTKRPHFHSGRKRIAPRPLPSLTLAPWACAATRPRHSMHRKPDVKHRSFSNFVACDMCSVRRPDWADAVSPNPELLSIRSRCGGPVDLRESVSLPIQTLEGHMSELGNRDRPRATLRLSTLHVYGGKRA